MREFASQKALISYTERKGLIYLWEGTPAFVKRQRVLSQDTRLLMLAASER